MTKSTILWAAAVSALLPSASVVGCGSQGSSSGAGDVYSVALAVSTVGALPRCTSTLDGTVAHVDSPPSLYRCANDSWSQISCDVAEGGSVAYASSPPTLWACVHSLWTQVGLPDAGPPGPRGPAGPQGPPGEAGITPTITVTPEPAGPNCAAGGIRVDVESDGKDSTSYVCNGVSAEGMDAGMDATKAEGGVDAGPNTFQQYAQSYAQAFCAQLLECCSGYDSGVGIDVASCVAQQETSGFENTLPGNAAAYTDGHLSLNSTAAANCIAALPTLSCGTVTAAANAAVTNDCCGVFQGTLSLGAGGCQSSFECASGYCQLPADGGAGECTALVATGDACTLQEMCTQAQLQATAYCTGQLSPDGGPGTCQPLLANGSPCVDQYGNPIDTVCAAQLCGDQGVCGGSYVNTSVGTGGVCPLFPYPDGG